MITKAERCAERGEFIAAIDFATRAVEAHPQHPAGYSARAVIYENAGEFEYSAKDFSTLISFGQSYMLDDRGRVYEKMGELDLATADYCEFLERYGSVASLALTRTQRLEGNIDSKTTPTTAELRRTKLQSLKMFFDKASVREPQNQVVLKWSKSIVGEMK